jgi:hypothetical protein
MKWALELHGGNAYKRDIGKFICGSADFAVWFRVGVSVMVSPKGGAGLGVEVNTGIAIGCDGQGHPFIFPTIDVGFGVAMGAIKPIASCGKPDLDGKPDLHCIGKDIGVDVFANFVGDLDGQYQSSAWGRMLGWGLGADFNFDNVGFGTSPTRFDVVRCIHVVIGTCYISVAVTCTTARAVNSACKP